MNRSIRVLISWVIAVLAGGTAAVAAEPMSDYGRVVRVGPGHALRTIAEAARIARAGDTVEIDAGDYRGDVAVWRQGRLTIRGVGGRVRLIAEGRHAEGKAIWVAAGGELEIENVDFVGTRVPDGDGAGIRHQSGRLKVRNCRFLENEIGLMTANNQDLELVIENSEFAHNGSATRIGHQLYVGRIARLVVRGSYFHDGRVGHLLKSRARENYVLYNRLTDGAEGRASYELEFPDGGAAYVLGNVIQQSAVTENPTIVSFGAEGLYWPRNALFFSHNTVVNDRTRGGRFVFARYGTQPIRLVNNLWVGAGAIEIPGSARRQGNHQAQRPDFAAADRFDFRLTQGNRLIGRVETIGEVDGFSLQPTEEPVAPLQTTKLAGGRTLSPGAMQTPAGSAP